MIWPRISSLSHIIPSCVTGWVKGGQRKGNASDGRTYGYVAGQKVLNANRRHKRPPTIEDNEDWTAHERVPGTQILAVGFVRVFMVIAVIELADIRVVFVINIFVAPLGCCFYANDKRLALVSRGLRDTEERRSGFTWSKRRGRMLLLWRILLTLRSRRSGPCVRGSVHVLGQ
jgi:hypothetical protein